MASDMFRCAMMCFVSIFLSVLVSLHVCFFNDTATTEIYTYCHTLSLHDALPICLVNDATALTLFRVFVAAAAGTGVSWLGATGMFLLAAVGEIGRAHVELQSLMRISYAVFCLKKKTHNTITKYTDIKHNIPDRITNIYIT